MLRMKRIESLITSLTLSVVSALAATPAVTIAGGSHPAVAIEPERSAGLAGVFVVDSSGNLPLSATYTPSVPGASVTWSRFSTLGAGYAEPIPGAEGYTLSDLRPDMGYIVTENNRQHCFWVTDYATKPFEIDNLSVASSDCGSVTLRADGEGARMTYFSVNGRGIEIDRQIHVSYTTLVYDKDAGNYQPHEVTENFSYLHSELHVEAPLTSTRFMIEGDRFRRSWGNAAYAATDLTEATAVAATVDVRQPQITLPGNQQTSEDTGNSLGGSAPVDIEFEATVTDAVAFTEWQFASDPDFTIIDLRFTDPVMTYSFRESGVTYIRFVAANADGSCEYVSDTYEVNIGESDIKCPNAFSPGTSEGQNDEWRVSYRSIVDFDCEIFTRSGKRVAHLTDPSQGWDGRINGRLAPAGVYYYVIKAVGSDGRRYNLSGDINIIGQR